MTRERSWLFIVIYFNHLQINHLWMSIWEFEMTTILEIQFGFKLWYIFKVSKYILISKSILSLFLACQFLFECRYKIKVEDFHGFRVVVWFFSKINEFCEISKEKIQIVRVCVFYSEVRSCDRRFLWLVSRNQNIVQIIACQIN